MKGVDSGLRDELLRAVEDLWEMTKGGVLGLTTLTEGWIEAFSGEQLT